MGAGKLNRFGMPRVGPDKEGREVRPSLNDSGHIEFILSMSPDAYAMLFRLARSSGQELKDEIGKAFLLYEAAVQARDEGKAVGIAPNEDVLETVFTGL